MEKINPTTPDLTQENVARIAALFPDVVTEVTDADGTLRHVIDFEALKDDLGASAVSGQRERYQFTWPGKRAAKAEARAPFEGTLRPVRDKSKDWDATGNVYIEGDNLQALKLLRETYAGKVKLIYIDPPYNTGHDFVYDDDFAQSRGDYEALNGELDEEGGRLVANPESNGRFHSDWCSMIYPRLLLARDLLSVDGAIFISIDDNESMNLRKICDEVFGAENFKSDISWQKRYTRSNNTIDFTTMIEHIIVYSKSNAFQVNLLPRTAEADSSYSNPDNDPRGPWMASSFVNPATKEQRPNLTYSITAPDGRVINHPTHAWKRSREEYKRLANANMFWWGADGTAQYPRLKQFLSEARGLTPINFWSNEYAGNTDQGGSEVQELFEAKVFNFPKPVQLLVRVLEHASSKNSLILDFFSGSATMAHAVMKKNAEDGGNRRFIMVQLSEACEEKSEAYKAGYCTLCDIGEERIRRAGAKIAQEVAASNAQLKLGEDPKPIPDVGFRVFRIDSSNFLDVRRTPADTTQATLDAFIDNLKSDRTPEDLLFQVLPAFRIPYSAHIEQRDVCGRQVFDVNGGQLMACFDTQVGNDVIEAIAKEKPLYAVFRDASLADDATEANFEELFKCYSPDTIRRVI